MRRPKLFPLQPAVLSCRYGDRASRSSSSDCGGALGPAFTTSGMGHGFNLPRFAAFYRAGDSPQLTAFYQELIARENEAERSFASPEFSGPRFALEMLVDVSSSPSGRAVAVHNRFEVPDVGGGQSVELQPGVQTTVLVTPSEVRTDDGLDALPVERKGCVSYDDVEEGRGPRLELFSAYGQEGCQFECYMHQVKAEATTTTLLIETPKL